MVDGRFKGGWTTRHYGRPAEGVHAVQFELVQAAYMDEANPREPVARSFISLEFGLSQLFPRPKRRRKLRDRVLTSMSHGYRRLRPLPVVEPPAGVKERERV